MDGWRVIPKNNAHISKGLSACKHDEEARIGPQDDVGCDLLTKILAVMRPKM